MKYSIKECVSYLESPVLIVSSCVGMGNYSVGEAFKQRCDKGVVSHHVVIEDFLPDGAVQEDLHRYKCILKNFKFLLWLIYKWPIFYYLKYFREKYLFKTDLSALEKRIHQLNIKTVICVSHRPSFWLSLLKANKKLDVGLFGVLTEFGTSLGWKYISWGSMNGYFSVMPKERLDLPFPILNKSFFKELELPCRLEFLQGNSAGSVRDNLLFVAGYWGEVGVSKAIGLIKALLIEMPNLNVYVVCGINDVLEKELKRYFILDHRVKIYGKVNSLQELLFKCRSVITKPGFSTIIEAYTSSRKIFLLKGIPVAEAQNAAYAIEFFCAEWYSLERFKQWYKTT